MPTMRPALPQGLLDGFRTEPVPASDETLVICTSAELAPLCARLVEAGGELATMTGLDLRPSDGTFAVEFVFGLASAARFIRVRSALPAEHPAYESVTTLVPAAQWYEREAKDLLGIEPLGHPDPRRLVLHESYPNGYHPLRKDVDAAVHPPMASRHFDYFEVHGEGVYEMGVGPIHAGVIEPGHFRFSNVGDLILYLDARLFYTHRGVEKLVETKSFEEAAFIVERTCGACTVSHATSFATAVERLTQTSVPPRAEWLRTLLLELERLYNHVGDIGNICAGTGFHAGTMRGAALKEQLQALNETLTGHRFMMGTVAPGGLRYDIEGAALREAVTTLRRFATQFEAYMDLILDNSSFVRRIDGPGRLDALTARALGATGVAARASGVAGDYRVDHPHLLYPDLAVKQQGGIAGDVGARFRLRAEEVRETLRLVGEILAGMPGGAISARLAQAAPGASALGYTESPRGANVHWVMADADGRVYRVRIRSASFANWPVVPRAVAGNVVPDFPLINKSFELCYACCDR